MACNHEVCGSIPHSGRDPTLFAVKTRAHLSSTAHALRSACIHPGREPRPLAAASPRFRSAGARRAVCGPGCWQLLVGRPTNPNPTGRRISTRCGRMDPAPDTVSAAGSTALCWTRAGPANSWHDTSGHGVSGCASHVVVLVGRTRGSTQSLTLAVFSRAPKDARDAEVPKNLGAVNQGRSCAARRLYSSPCSRGHPKGRKGRGGPQKPWCALPVNLDAGQMLSNPEGNFFQKNPHKCTGGACPAMASARPRGDGARAMPKTRRRLSNTTTSTQHPCKSFPPPHVYVLQPEHPTPPACRGAERARPARSHPSRAGPHQPPTYKKPLFRQSRVRAAVAPPPPSQKPLTICRQLAPAAPPMDGQPRAV